MRVVGTSFNQNERLKTTTNKSILVGLSINPAISVVGAK